MILQGRNTGRAARLRARVVLLTSIVSAFLLIALTAVTVIDVVGRYVFNAPLSGASELTEFLLLGIIFIGLPAITLDDDHIAIDLLTSQLAQRPRTVLKFVARVLSAGFFGFLGWQLLEHAKRLEAYQDITVFLRIPFAPFCTAAAYLMMLCSLILCLQIVGPLFHRSSGVSKK
ncbi:TRAP transporter small permease [Hoeflea poritis]|uniref:TRAP transporter small permease protein n=1 Tax=Hoeflea poritis TaxID=2993659 RepID=A0ABT4VV27_9HYPH|nr:TRAP transporter small permease [Hoeflea poritis]MDA4848571.1 TRAP transporter small permease [Hoeflea poritis]